MIEKVLSDDHDFRTGMYAVITGSGSPMVDPWRGNASAAVVVDGTVLHFDCGRKMMDNLVAVGIVPLDIDYLLFTHLHFDHIALYGYLAIASWISGRQQDLRVIGPPGTRAMSEATIFDAHAVDVAFVNGLVAAWPDHIRTRPRDEPPIAATDVETGVVLATDAFEVTAAETPHYREHGVINYAYRVDCEHGSVVVSGDGRPSDNIVELARGADVLIHECTRPDPGMVSGGKLTEARGSSGDGDQGGHTTPTGLGRLAAAAGVRKVVATHLGSFTSVPAAVEMTRLYFGGTRQGPEFWTEFATRIAREFSGDVVLADDAMVIPVGER